MKQIQRTVRAMQDAQAARQELVDLGRGQTVTQQQLVPVLVGAGDNAEAGRVPSSMRTNPAPELPAEAIEVQQAAAHGTSGRPRFPAAGTGPARGWANEWPAPHAVPGRHLIEGSVSEPSTHIRMRGLQPALWPPCVTQR